MIWIIVPVAFVVSFLAGCAFMYWMAVLAARVEGGIEAGLSGAGY